MTTVHIWKLGNYYDKVEDRNGGQAEFNYISEAVTKACNRYGARRSLLSLPIEDEKQDLSDGRVVSFIVNGVMDKNDFFKVRTARKLSDILVYVFTDYSFIYSNMRVIEQCDFILHQSALDRNFNVLTIPGAYSYIPELFYDENIPVSSIKANLCFFGGNEIGREVEFREYIAARDYNRHTATIKKGMMAFFKDMHGNDFRIAYPDYRRILSLFRFAFVSGRVAGMEYGWVTPRLVEAVNAGSIPILIENYDIMDHFGYSSNRVRGYTELDLFMDEADLDEEAGKLACAQGRIHDGQKKFYELMKEIFFEIKPLHSK